MRRPVILFLSTLLLAVFIHSCTSASKDQLAPLPKGCQAAESGFIVSYSENIVPIFESNCYGCHGATSNQNSGGINLQDNTTLQKYLDNGQLSGNVNHFPGYNPMPPAPAPILDSCSLQMVNAWINQGSPINN